MHRSYPSGQAIASHALVDLQTHTAFSDGDWQATDLLDYFVSAGFAAAAITDHDRVDTMDDLQRLAAERGFPLLVATEMTTRWRGQIVDILCFGFEAKPAPLQALCDAVYQAQSATSQRVVQQLIEAGYLPPDAAAELPALLSATTSKQPHLLYDLCLRHYPPFEQDFAPIKAAGYTLCSNPTAAVVEAAHQCGAVALIAHPGRSDGFATFDAELLDAFHAEIPIDGLEVYYPRHTPAQEALYATYAAQQNWLVSAGSDSHHPAKPPIAYPAKLCAALLERLGLRCL